ncbi:glycoside hydrolase family protein [Nodosilinea sp. LEGE 06152]|uniref:glycoside hydrolase family protein n=1 Tax=Nodosilinea sp. LEGE 06152 TaxID=2777966 RepID=UPI0018816CAC|nr:glycoside hydrolase family protein [Nodosilinea sp. LEGE 06152]MBE9160669.1 glycoside hydrolase family protein [Nodosilinea sp. LEGE 06152]
MGNQTKDNSAALRAVEQLYREVRELRAVTDAGFTQLGADVTALRKTQADTERKVSATAAWNDLKFDAITWLTLLSIILASQVYVSAVRNAPDWLKAMLPGLEQPAADGSAPAGQPESKQVVAFSRPGELLRKGAPLEGTPYTISSTVGWRHVFGAKDWHEGYDVSTPVGTPLYTVLPVEVQCLTEAQSGGGGIGAAYTVGNERHLWLHLASCTPGTYSSGEQFATTGNTGRSTGAHLDYRVKDMASGEWVRPYADVLRLTLNPDAAIAQANPGIDAPGMVELIKSFEGFHPKPYWDYQQWSWGFGTRAPGANGTIDQASAERELLAYLERNCLPAIAPLGLAEHQAAALASFCYNVGPHQFVGSDTYRHAQAGNHAAAAAALLNWTKAGGKVLPGLVKRREKERAVYLGQ